MVGDVLCNSLCDRIVGAMRISCDVRGTCVHGTRGRASGQKAELKCVPFIVSKVYIELYAVSFEFSVQMFFHF